MNEEIETKPKINQKVFTIIIILLLIACAFLIRFFLRYYESYDYLGYIRHWLDYMRQKGFLAFKDDFANYNLPYLYFLYLLNLLPFSKLILVKAFSVLFDFIMAFGIYLIVRFYTPKDVFKPIFAGAISLLLPSVFINSSLLGQCDVIYTCFLIYSFYGILTRRPFLTWIMWSFAFIFKMQAIFFGPLLLVVWLLQKEKRWYAPFVFVPIFFLPFIPAMIAGRSFSSVLSIYFSQYASQTGISENAPNFYQWIPNQFFDTFKIAAIFTGLASIFIVTYMIFKKYYKKIDTRSLVTAAALLFYVVPYFLPSMHDRYFYPAEIFIFLMAFLYPRDAWLAVVSQVISVLVYTKVFLEAENYIPLSILAIFVLVIIVVLAYRFFYKKEETDLPTG